MKIDIPTLKFIINKKAYKWFDDLNLIGIRTTIQVPDVFNDLMCIVWKQPTMVVEILNNRLSTQKWLNENLFLGADSKPLIEDGVFGTNSQFAYDNYQKTVGLQRLKIYTITTDPGVYWLEHPMSTLGAADVVPAQNINCWGLGFHKQNPQHEALVQISPIKVYRDNNKDSTVDDISKIETGMFGIDIHGANKIGITTNIGQWSAGCQVFNEWAKKEEFISICKIFKAAHNNKFTYTLLEEKDFS